MLLQLSDYKRYLPPNTITDQTKFDAFETRALYRFFPRYLGNELIEEIIDPPFSEDSGTADYSELILKMAPALANLTYLLSIPFFNVVLTNSGFGVVSNQNVAPASVERVKDLKEACLQAANDGIETLLDYLEANAELYDLWNASSLNEGALIENASEFSAAIGFTVHRNVFVDLIEHINRMETNTLTDLFSAEFIADLKDSDDTLVKPQVIKALANFAWHEYNLTQSQKAPSSQMSTVNYSNIATQYATRALTLLRKNISDYPVFEEYGYEAPYDNSDENDEEGGFYVGGLTA